MGKNATNRNDTTQQESNLEHEQTRTWKIQHWTNDPRRTDRYNQETKKHKTQGPDELPIELFKELTDGNKIKLLNLINGGKQKICQKA